MNPKKYVWLSKNENVSRWPPLCGKRFVSHKLRTRYFPKIGIFQHAVPPRSAQVIARNLVFLIDSDVLN